jgi:hypothetical protein
MKHKILLIQVLILSVIFSINTSYAQETIPYEDLETYLPSDISGYTAGDPEGQTMSMQGFSFSSASIEFYNSDDNSIRITLIDYIAASSMFQAATAMWGSGMSYENDEMSARSIDWSDNIAGWEEFNKVDNEATLVLGIGDRFLLTIEAENQSGIDFVKSVAKDMDLEELSDIDTGE